MYSDHFEAARVAAAEKAAAEAEAARVKAEAEAAEAEAARVKAEAEAAEAARVAEVQASVLAHMKEMEKINKRMGFKAPPPPPPPPPVVHAPNGYAISPRVVNFPSDYNYYAQPAERPVPVIELSPQAREYENREQKLAKQLQSNARLNSQLDSLRQGMVGGRKKKSKRQKKQHRRRNRRRSTRKYRK
jgi:hypothetical protein